MSESETPPDPIRDDPVRLLKWLVEAGADEAIADEPVDRFEVAPKPAKQETSRPRSTAPRPATAAPHDESLATARTLAQSCQTLDDLREAIENFEGCGLKHTAHSTVFADGNPKANLMLVGEAPARRRPARPAVCWQEWTASRFDDAGN